MVTPGKRKWGGVGGNKPHAASCLRFLSIFSLVMKKALCVEPLATSSPLIPFFTVHVPTDTRFSYILVIPPFDNLLSSVDNGFFETLSQRLEQELTQRYSPAVLAAERWESLCKDIGQTRGQSLGARFRWLCSKEAHGSDLEVILFSWLGWGKVVDVDNWQLLRVLCPK